MVAHFPIEIHIPQVFDPWGRYSFHIEKLIFREFDEQVPLEMIDVLSLQLVDDGAFKNVEEINVALLLAIVDQLSRLVFFYRYVFP